MNTNEITQDRWLTAQASEFKYWDDISITELLRICAEKPAFLDLIDYRIVESLFEEKDVMEIGVGPLGVSIASFYKNKHQIRRLVKVEPLEKILIKETSLMNELWARMFVEWVDSLSEEGDYVQLPGEQMVYSEEFDTVIIYNVLDHVKEPESILKNAYNALRKGGRILVGVDCRSVLGLIKFEYILRNTRKGEILVEAHPYSFLPSHIVRMLNKVGFENIQAFGVPGLVDRFVGRISRPAFIGMKK